MSHDGHTHLVTLFVERAKDGADPDDRLWAHVEGERTVYQYRFEPPFGAVRVQVGKPNTVLVRLKAGEGIALHDLRIESDPYHQLRVVRDKCGPREFVIENENERVQVAYYSIFVKAGDAVLACDPMIFNRPR
jgi:hypothetical protein